MPNVHSVLRKRRKFTGNQYTAAGKTDTGIFSCSEEEEIDVEMDGDVGPKWDYEEQLIKDVVETPRTTKSALHRKEAVQCQGEESSSSLEEEEETAKNCGFTLIDLKFAKPFYTSAKNGQFF